MTDRYHGHPHPGRSATFNPATTSLPASIGYTSLYAGDMHVMPSSTRQQATPAAPREYVTTTSSIVPSTTTRTYAVTQDPRSQRPTTRDVTRGHRSSTLDSTTGRPVIIMTTQQDRSNPVSSHSSNARSGSPIRDDYRASEGQFYTQPASSIRSRTSTRPFSEHLGSDDYARSRDHNEVDSYRSSRPSVTYPSNPRHSSSTIDYGDDGYSYTNAGDLVRYDLEHPQSHRSRRHESFDRGYRRPDINYNPEQRTFDVNTGPDQSRNYITTTRQLETRGGPPPTTRGFDKIPRAYESPRDSVPAAPAAPEPTVTLRQTGSEGRRPRPVSLYQESVPRSQHHDDYYRSRDDERAVREQRQWELEPDRSYGSVTYEPQTYESQPAFFHDDRVSTRGFGIRTEPSVDDYNYRRDPPRVEEPMKRSDEALSRDTEPSRRNRTDTSSRTDTKEPSRRESREIKKGNEDDEKERSRLRDKISSGLGIAAAAVGITPALKADDKRSKDDSKGRRGSDEGEKRRRDSDVRDGRSSTREARNKDDRDRSESRIRRETSSRKNDQAVVSGSDSDDVKKTKRQNRLSSAAFNPNDAADLTQLKEQLAAMKSTDKEKEKPVVIETTRTRSSSPTKVPKPTKEVSSSSGSVSPPEIKPARKISPPSESRRDSSVADESRGREVSTVSSLEKQVRVVSPPREKKDEKPLRGILKAPKVSFPEDPNPIREGVAPHKEDKKIKEAPAGAKWTKISRKIVNPEALTVGKERFEVRDDFVIVLRVLSKEEIQAYAAATQVLRERRQQKEEEDDNDKDYDRRDDDEKRKHRHRRHRDDDDYEEKDRERDRDRDRERDRPRRRRHRDEDDYDSRSKDQDHHHRHHHHY